MRIGVLSDTHGYIDPRALTALYGVAHILHAGDIGSTAVITDLEAIAPVSAISGNVDMGTPLAQQHPSVQRLGFEGVSIYMTHVGDSPASIVAHLPAPKPDVYIFGHSHVALLETHDNIMFLNPGAAGRPRFGGRLSVALLNVNDGKATARIVYL